MELLYIWIEDYKNIHEQGFNFSPKHHFEFSLDNKKESTNSGIIGGKLTLKEKDYSLPDNFFGDNIVNITGIVGKNGSGKSSLLEVLSKWMKNDYTKLFFAVKDNNEITVYHHKNVTVKSDFSTSPVSEFDKGKGLSLGLASIFFSNSFSPTVFFNPKSIYIYSQNKSLTYELQKIEEDHFRESSISAIREYWFDNLKSITEFIEKENESDKILKLLGKENGIKRITVRVYSFHVLSLYKDPSAFRVFNNISKFRKYEQFVLRLFKNIISIIASTHIDNILISIKDENAVKKILVNLNNPPNPENIYKFYSGYRNYVIDEIKEEFNNLNKIFENINDFYKNYKNLVIDTENLKKFITFAEKIYNSLSEITDLKQFKNIFSKKLKELGYEKFQSLFDYIISIKKEDIEFYGISNIEVNFNIPLKYISELIDKYKATLSDEKNIKDYLFFDWGLSSGELAFINLFSKLFEAKKEIKKKAISKNDIIKTYLILLDEIDLYLHPEWSKQNIYLLTEVLPLIFDKPVQIIATAHSPFIASDLPKEHIIFLDKDKKTGNCKVIPEIDQKQTFGANIHTLFTDAFFQDGLIGKFAEEKIQKAITYLNEQELSEDEIKYCKEIIQITGEPILKNQLQKMLTSKLETKNKSEIDVLKKQMRYIKTKISKLENKNKKR